ncbi:MAG: hypothetical protein Athens071416_325 [Parcubacteria group bacterium Athens0714_16]|nr:MAG: hypothetical protein Athens071416_325 [Parcubacteria group bacterium Athens0714_16]
METLTIFEPFTVQIEDTGTGNVIRYVDEGDVKTINDVGCIPNGKLILKPILVKGIIKPLSLIRDSRDMGFNLGLYHALSLINSHSLTEELKDYKILFPGTLRIACQRAFIPTLFFSKDLNARWRTSCNWIDEFIGEGNVFLKFKVV